MQTPNHTDHEFVGPRNDAVSWGEDRKRELLIAGTKSIRVDMQSLADGTMRMSLVPGAAPKTPRREVA